MNLKLELEPLIEKEIAKNDAVQELWIATCTVWIAASNRGTAGMEVLFPARDQPKRCWPVVHRLAMKAAFGPAWFAAYYGGLSLHLPSAIFEKWKTSPACTQQLARNLNAVLQSTERMSMMDWVRAGTAAYEFRLADLHAKIVEKLAQMRAPVSIQAVVHLGSPF